MEKKTTPAGCTSTRSMAASFSIATIFAVASAGAPVSMRFVPAAGAAQQLTMAVGETMPLFLDGKADITFPSAAGFKQYSLDANCAYYFGRSADGRVDLQRIGLGDDGTAAAGRQ